MSFFLPKAAIDQHVAILGKTGSGKTFTAKLVVEHVLRQERTVRRVSWLVTGCLREYGR